MKILGYLMIAIPALGFFALMVYVKGWFAAMFIFAMPVLLIGWIFTASWLMEQS